MNTNIVEHIKREQTYDSGLPVKLTISSIAALPTVNALEDSALFEISELTKIPGDPVDYYTSKNVKWSTILAKLQQSLKQLFDIQYIEYRFSTLNPTYLQYPTAKETTVWKYLTANWEKDIVKCDVDLFGTVDDTESTPYVWSDVWALARGEIILNKYLKSLDLRVQELEAGHLAFGPNMEFNTILSTFQGDNSEQLTSNPSTETMTHAYRNAESGVNSDGFVMAFFRENKLSSIFTCPKSGILTLYGWIDSSNVTNGKYLPSAWCALKGKINGSWEILQVQSVVPAKQFSYISFCVPVMLGLEVQLELGFPPGNASGRYDRGKIPESLANTRPNAFLGGIFSQTLASQANP